MIEKPTVRRGFSDANGSWKMNWMFRRSACRSAPFIALMSRPSNSIEPLCDSTRRSSERPVVDLPQPDSPTSASVSPARSSKLTRSTACTYCDTRLNTPLFTGNRVTRSRTRRIGGAAGSTGGCASAASCAADAGAAAPVASTFSSGNFSGISVPCIEPSRGTAASSARV
ncbi:hypothetical protein BamMEX5DRAFT_6154 [Burkholderia ambifaria MEX-5]|uniref:Uncharacterized protein n=1 Tax=Burkholderia ambifaria MEX-5 TaxID=396597 RepID=B1TED8_9BURK|nr:hypothetical protein BamMEX5DRAFT_6154 [Burkholderia ambifaria MEX-5]